MMNTTVAATVCPNWCSTHTPIDGDEVIHERSFEADGVGVDLVRCDGGDPDELILYVPSVLTLAQGEALADLLREAVATARGQR